MQSRRDAVISAQLENTDCDDLHYFTAGTDSRAQPVQASRHGSMTADKIIPTYAEHCVKHSGCRLALTLLLEGPPSVAFDMWRNLPPPGVWQTQGEC